jgi:hypothetical protein
LATAARRNSASRRALPFEIVRPLTGKIAVVIAGKHRHPRPGEEVVVPRKTPHHIRNPTEEQAIYLYGFRRKR